MNAKLMISIPTTTSIAILTPFQNTRAIFSSPATQETTRTSQFPNLPFFPVTLYLKSEKHTAEGRGSQAWATLQSEVAPRELLGPTRKQAIGSASIKYSIKIRRSLRKLID
jgi:hypothetical protein